MFGSSKSSKQVLKQKVVVQTATVDVAFSGWLVEQDGAGLVLQGRMDDPLKYHSPEGTKNLEAGKLWIPMQTVSYISTN